MPHRIPLFFVAVAVLTLASSSTPTPAGGREAVRAPSTGGVVDCRKLGLMMPDVINARMRRPGNEGGLPQSVRIDARYGSAKAFADTCQDGFEQIRQVVVQIKNKAKNGWLNIAAGGRITTKKRWAKIGYLDEEGVGQVIIAPAGHSPDDRFFNKDCRAVRAIFRNKVLEVEQGSPVGQRVKRVRVALGGRCAA